MAEAYVERRRSPRIAVAGGARFDRPVALSVRLLDVGAGGAMISSPQPLAVGQFAHLSMRLNGVLVEADIEVRRALAQRDENGAFRVGARFLSLDTETADAMKRFLSSRAT